MIIIKSMNCRRITQFVLACLEGITCLQVALYFFFVLYLNMDRFSSHILNSHLVNPDNNFNDTGTYNTNYSSTNVTHYYYQHKISTIIGTDGIISNGRSAEIALEYYAPYALTFFSTLATLSVFCASGLVEKQKMKKHWKLKEKLDGRSTTLPGYGTLGDTVNEVVELFLNTLAICVHNNGNRDCPRRMLCEANQKSVEYGMGYGITTYFLSLAVSFLLEGQRVSESMEAMRRGRHGMDCRYSYPRCPFSL